MQSIIQFFKNIWHHICNFRQYHHAAQYERLLKKGIIKRDLEKIKLLREASELIPKKTRKGISLYIPMTYTSRMKIKAVILANFGIKMRVLGMKITDDLKFV